MKLKTLSELFSDWNENIKPEVIRQYGESDGAALSESWNEFTDSECKDGKITDLQYHYCPAWDDEMPSEDGEFVLDAMGVTLAASRVLERPDIDSDDWPAGMYHWRIMIQYGKESMMTHYSMGSALAGEPCEGDVFNCLLSDSEGVENESFEDWANDMGYDSDSRKAERTFKACQQTLADLKRLFSASELSDLREIFNDY